MIRIYCSNCRDRLQVERINVRSVKVSDDRVVDPRFVQDVISREYGLLRVRSCYFVPDTNQVILRSAAILEIRNCGLHSWFWIALHLRKAGEDTMRDAAISAMLSNRAL